MTDPQAFHRNELPRRFSAGRNRGTYPHTRVQNPLQDDRKKKTSTAKLSLLCLDFVRENDNSQTVTREPTRLTQKEKT